MLLSTSLAGSWDFALDPEGRGEPESWWTRPLTDSITLPGSVDQAAKTPLTTAPTMHYLSRRHPYVGKAWYRRRFTVVPDAAGMFHWLVLERPHGALQVWLNGLSVGRDESLSAPCRFLLGSLAAGEYQITLLIDNARFEAVGDALVRLTHPTIPDVAHSKSDHTQTNWNGVVGTIAIEAAHARIAQVCVTAPDRHVALRVELEALDTDRFWPTFWLQPADDTLVLTFDLAGLDAPLIVTRPLAIENAYTPVEISVDLPESAALWDEFAPVVHGLTVEWHRNGTVLDRQQTTFGIRRFERDGRRLRLNGRAVFLRGTLDCCIFPLTGYPPTGHDGWRKVMRVVKDYGLNHIRFHSWCPPRAAFEMADAAGVMLHVETPIWAVLGTDPALDRYIHAEAERIVAEYGNHPSFVMLTVGNEVDGTLMHAFLERFVDKWRKADPRRLYNGGSGWPTTQRADYLTKPEPRSYRWGEGLASRLNARPLETRTDWSEWVASVPQPLISHEIGQWCAYPNLAEIPKYTGVVEARNFGMVRDDLVARGRLDQAADYTLNSGALQTQLYKEDIEAALRTRDFAGFQLLGLQDFPGQGTAIVGAVDAFWDAKPYVDGAAYRRFCGPVVPLLRADGFVLTAGQEFVADAQLAQFGPVALRDWRVDWALDGEGGGIASGHFQGEVLTTGDLHDLGGIRISTNGLATGRYTLTLSLAGQQAANDWPVWVFAAAAPAPLTVVQDLTPAVLDRIEAGETVVLSPDPARLRPTATLGHTTIFWGTLWTQGQPPHTLGLINDTAHPLFAAFPAERHSDWHLWDWTAGRRPFDIAGLGFHPITRVIDDWFQNRDLALLAEAGLGKGRLILCAPEIETGLGQRPVALALRNAIAALQGAVSPVSREAVAVWWRNAQVAPQPEEADVR